MIEDRTLTTILGTLILAIPLIIVLAGMWYASLCRQGREVIGLSVIVFGLWVGWMMTR